MPYRLLRSTGFSANGFNAYPIHSPAKIAGPVIATRSILQIELSLTQVLDRPVSGRIFFEEVIRENLDIGRPKQVQLIFDRWLTKSTPGSFRTRVITDGVIRSLHIDYKGTRIKPYHKEGQALRTETTINNTRDFYIGKSLNNLPALRQIGFQANRRLLRTQTITHDCILAEETFQQLNQPRIADNQRVSALLFADKTVQVSGTLYSCSISCHPASPTGTSVSTSLDSLGILSTISPRAV